MVLEIYEGCSAALPTDVFDGRAPVADAFCVQQGERLSGSGESVEPVAFGPCLVQQNPVERGAAVGHEHPVRTFGNDFGNRQSTSVELMQCLSLPLKGGRRVAFLQTAHNARPLDTLEPVVLTVHVQSRRTARRRLEGLLDRGAQAGRQCGQIEKDKTPSGMGETGRRAS